jgi:hypothetical protein
MGRFFSNRQAAPEKAEKSGGLGRDSTRPSLVSISLARPLVGPRTKDTMKNLLRSLAGRIILLVFLATVVSALTVSWISVQSLDGFLRQKVNQRFPQVASRIAHDFEQWYLVRARELEVFASSTILTESAPRLSAGRRSAWPFGP